MISSERSWRLTYQSSRSGFNDDSRSSPKALELLQYPAGRWAVIWRLPRTANILTLPQNGGRAESAAVQQQVPDSGEVFVAGAIEVIQMSKEADDLIAYCRENNRVCPNPNPWNEVWKILPDRKQIGAGWEPPLPLILAAWYDTPAMSKMLRLAEHIQWADNHGALPQVAAFLRNLREEDWHHIGE